MAVKESHLRSVIKSISWRTFGSIFTIFISFFITGELSISLYIGLFEFTFKIILFYLHERLWNIIPLGMPKKL